MKKLHSRIRTSPQDTIFLALNGLLLTAFFLLLLYPLLFVLIASCSGQATVMTLSLWPESFSLIGYKAVFDYYFIWVGYRNSLLYLATGTIISIIITIMCAYPLSITQ